jgi:hypothetical protein
MYGISHYPVNSSIIGLVGEDYTPPQSLYQVPGILVTVQRLVKLVWASKIGYLIQELPDAFERAFAQGRTVAH